jgi:hypothetical protein
MGAVLAFLTVYGGLAAIVGGLGWVAVRARRRGVGAGVMGVFDEIWHPAAQRYRVEIQVQAERMVPMPSPEDKPWDSTDNTPSGPAPTPS